MTASRDVRRTTVLVAGAGPAGLAAAAELAHHGIPSMLVEPRCEVSTDRPRAKTTSVRTMEHFRRWGIADAVRAAAPLQPGWSDSVIFCDTLLGHEVTRFTHCFGLAPDGDDRFAEGGQQIPQPLVERVLREHVNGQTSVDVMWGATVAALTEDEDGVDAVVRTGDGDEVTVRCDYLLGCDGASGVVRRSLGIAYQGRSDDRQNFNLVFRAPGLKTPLGRAVQYWVVGDRAAGLVGRLDLDGLWWAIAPGVDAETGRANASQIVAGLVGEPVQHEVMSTDPWTARMLVAERFGSSRVFLVGEAAHLNPPWGGHGYNTCVGDAVNLCWKLAAVIRGWGGPGLLTSYERERRPVATDTITLAEHNMATLSTDLAGLRQGGDEAAFAAAIQAGKRAEFHSLGLVLGYSYAGSPIVSQAPVPAPVPVPAPAPAATDPTHYEPNTEPGSRLPHLWLRPGRSLYDELGRGMTLLGPLHDRPGEVAALRRRAAELGVPLAAVTSPSDYPWADEFLLVRPDQHVAARARSPLDLDLAAAVGVTTAVHTQPRTADQP